jgi:hypothetical protein
VAISRSRAALGSCTATHRRPERNLDGHVLEETLPGYVRPNVCNFIRTSLSNP